MKEIQGLTKRKCSISYLSIMCSLKVLISLLMTCSLSMLVVGEHNLRNNEDNLPNFFDTKKSQPIHDSSVIQHSARQKSTNANEFAQKVRRILRRNMTPVAAGNILRMCFHDAGTWNESEGTGGANGSILLPEELSQPVDGALDIAIAIVLKSKREVDEELEIPLELAMLGVSAISLADIIMLAGAEACACTGGPVFAIPLGRPDAIVPDNTAMLPFDSMGANDLRALFSALGLTTRDLVTLQGAHTLGFSRMHVNLGPMTATPVKFDNQYFQALLEGHGFFHSDNSMMEDLETKAIVEEYAINTTSFFINWVQSFRKMSIMGVQGQNLRGG